MFSGYLDRFQINPVKSCGLWSVHYTFASITILGCNSNHKRRVLNHHIYIHMLYCWGQWDTNKKASGLSTKNCGSFSGISAYLFNQVDQSTYISR